jgi:hypothetical protein
MLVLWFIGITATTSFLTLLADLSVKQIKATGI